MKTKLSLMVVSFILVLIMIGCSTEGAADDSGDSASDAETQSDENADGDTFEPHNFDEHLTITWLTTGSPIPYEDNPVFELIEEKFNITLEFMFYDRSDYEDYLNTLAASGNLPDVWRFGHNDPRFYSDWVERGVLFDVKPLLEHHPDLTGEIPEEAWEVLNPPGEYYGVPEYRLPTRNMLAIRQDWLDNLGLEVPDTIEEFYDVAYAFAHDDPNGTGQNDTIGFSSIGLFTEDGAAWRGGAFGLANGWKEVEGELVPYQAQRDELKEYIAFMRKAYTEDVLDKDFMLHKDWRDANERLSEGIAGIEYVNPNSVHRKEEMDVKEHDPNAKLTYFPPPAGPSGERTTPTRPNYFKKVLNASISEAKAHRILALMEWNITDGYEITRHGLEGIHWQENDDGTIEELDAWEEHEVDAIGTNILRGWNYLHRAYWWLGEEFEEQLDTYYGELEQYTWQNDNPGLFSDTETEVGLQLDAEFEQMMTEIVVDRRPLEDVDEAVDQWLANGGEDIIREMNEKYTEYQAARQ